jgi:purine catabolism regulator
LCFAENPISHETRAIFDQAVAHIGVALARQRAIRATELRFAGELLDLIAAGPARYRDLTDRLTGFGVDPAKPLAIISISATHDGSSEPEVGALDTAIRELALPGVVLARGTEHMLILEAAREDLMLRAAKTTLHRLRTNPAVTGGAVGIGSLATHTSALRRTLSEARQAHTIAHHRQEPYSLALPEHAGSHALLLATADEEALSALVRSLIDPLREHDTRRHSELLRTLSTFLDHAGQWQRTAEDLYIHVNTLRQRITRIEALTGRNMSDMATRVDFYLALRAHQAI